MPDTWTHFLPLRALRVFLICRELHIPSLILSKVSTSLEPEPRVLRATRGQCHHTPTSSLLPTFLSSIKLLEAGPFTWLGQKIRQNLAVGWISEPRTLVGNLLVCFGFVEFMRGCCNFTQMRSPSPSLGLASHFPWCLVAWQLLEFHSSRVGSKVEMNYIFGNSTLYPRGGRANTGTAHSAPGSKQRQWAKRSSSEELPSSSRWQQLLAFFTRRNAFSDCITAGAGQVNSTMPTTCCRGAYPSARCVGTFIMSTSGWLV